MYTFALLLSPPLIAPVEGIKGGHVTFWGEGPVMAAVQPDLDLNTLLSEETTALAAVLAHDRVNQALFAAQTIVPLRFGTVFTSTETLNQYISEHQTTYQRQLLQLHGQGEFTLSYTPVPSPPPLVPGQGRAYFTQRKAQFAEVQRRQLEEQLAWEGVLATLTQQFGAQCQPDGTRVYALVAEAQWDSLITWAADQFTLTGPFPPYHFV